jgi:DNA polymerase III delta prime subunit
VAVGHDAIQSRLRKSLPPVSLLVGPESVGKTTIAFDLIRAHGVQNDDILRFKKLTVESARAISRASVIAPRGRMRVFVLWIDGASDAALNTLLKSLEEAPATSRFVLIGTELPMETVVSRSEVFRFALLSTETVEEILLRRGINPSVAKNAAKASRGQVQNAIRYVNGASEEKMGVLALIQALVNLDEEALNAQSQRWTEGHTNVLSTLSYEIITKQWRTFDPAEVEGVSSKLALRILEAIRPHIRGRLVVNASLMSILKGDA